MLVFSCMATARQNGKRDSKPSSSRSAESNGGRPVAVATTSYVNIIEALLENGSMSRSELASSIGLSRSALTEMSRVLIQHQFVEESPSVIDKQRKGTALDHALAERPLWVLRGCRPHGRSSLNGVDGLPRQRAGGTRDRHGDGTGSSGGRDCAGDSPFDPGLEDRPREGTGHWGRVVRTRKPRPWDVPAFEHAGMARCAGGEDR